MNYKVLVYKHDNLGDIIQTVAITRLLPQTLGIMRDETTELPGLSIINGYIARPTHCGDCLFAGIHLGTRFNRLRRWLTRSHFPIGTRDPYSNNVAQEWGLKTSLIGCATMALPRYEGPREGVYSVDYDGPGIKLSHYIKRRTPLDKQWVQAIKHLEIYRRAERVYTSRLHVALPCLAFGTPVYIDDTNTWRSVRFSILERLNISMRTLVTADLSTHKDIYVKFLMDHGVSVSEHDSLIPNFSAL